jgi:hypothetical protein
MRARVLLLGVVAALAAASGANAAPPVLEHGVFAGSMPPAPPFEPATPIKSFKIEILPF